MGKFIIRGTLRIEITGCYWCGESDTTVCTACHQKANQIVGITALFRVDHGGDLVKIRTQEWFIFSKRNIARGGTGAVCLTGFANRADADVRISDDEANGDAISGDLFSAQAEIDFTLGQTLVCGTGPYGAFIFHLFTPVFPGCSCNGLGTSSGNHECAQAAEGVAL